MVCSKTTKGMYVTSPSAVNFYCFLNNSDTAHSQKLKTINTLFLAETPNYL